MRRALRASISYRALVLPGSLKPFCIKVSRNAATRDLTRSWSNLPSNSC